MFSFIILVTLLGTARAAPGLIRGTVLAPSSNIVYASQVQLPVTNTIQYTVTNNLVPYYAPTVLKTGFVPSTVPIRALNNVVTAPISPATNALAALGNSPGSAPQGVSLPSQKVESLSNVPIDTQILSTDGRSGVIVEKLPDRVTEIVGGTEAIDSVPTQERTEVQHQNANFSQLPTDGSPDTVQGENIRQGPLSEVEDTADPQTLQARAAVTSNGAETDDNSQPQMPFRPAPRETYAKYYTGPPVLRT